MILFYIYRQFTHPDGVIVTDNDLEKYSFWITTATHRVTLCGLLITNARFAILATLADRWMLEHPSEPYWRFFKALSLAVDTSTDKHAKAILAIELLDGSTAQEAIVRLIVTMKLTTFDTPQNRYLSQLNAITNGADAVIMLAKYDNVDCIDLVTHESDAPHQKEERLAKLMKSSSSLSSPSPLSSPVTPQHLSWLALPKGFKMFYKHAIVDAMEPLNFSTSVPPPPPTTFHRAWTDRDCLLDALQTVPPGSELFGGLKQSLFNFVWTDSVQSIVRIDLLRTRDGSASERLWPEYVVFARVRRVIYALLLSGHKGRTVAMNFTYILDAISPLYMRSATELISAIATSLVFQRTFMSCTGYMELLVFTRSPDQRTLQWMLPRLLSHGYVFNARMMSAWIESVRTSQSHTIQKLAIDTAKNTLSIFTATNANDVYLAKSNDVLVQFARHLTPPPVLPSLSDIVQQLNTLIKNLETDIISKRKKLIERSTIGKRRVVYQYHRLCRLVPFQTVKAEQQMGYRNNTILKIVMQNTMPLFGDVDLGTNVSINSRKLIEDRAMNVLTLAYNASKETKIVLDRLFRVDAKVADISPERACT